MRPFLAHGKIVFDERTERRHSQGDPRSRIRRVVLVALMWLLTLVVLYVHLIAWPHRFQLGQMVPYTIFAPIDFTFQDDEKLAELTGNLSRDEVVKEVDDTFKQQSLRRLETFRADLRTLKAATTGLELSNPRAQELINALADQYQLEPRVVFNFLNYTPERLTQIFADAQRQIDERMSGMVTAALIRDLKLDVGVNAVVTPESSYVYFLMPNWRVLPGPDEEVKALAQVRVQAGEVIVRQGEQVNSRVLKQIELVWPQLLEKRFYTLGGLALLLAGGMLLWFQHLRRFSPRALLRMGALTQFGALFLSFLVLGLFVGRLPFNYIPYGVAFAVTCLACITVMIYDATFAAYFALGLAIVLSTALGYESDLLIYLMGGALFPTVTLSAWSRRRIQVLFAAVMGVFNAGLALAVIVMSPQPFSLVALAIAGAAGFAAAIVALGLLPVIETLSSQLTPGKLMELANPENELLKRLKREAHGTFAHSQMVADLVEEGCKEIGANWLLARVGALYHDVGKLRRPGFFAENIHDLTKNPHIGLPAQSSAKILKDHVTDGVAMASEVHLPRELHAFIAQHHGTYLIKYFYYQALELHRRDPKKFEEPSESFFHYPGPVPQSRESGVLMLADVTEAVTRARGEMEEEELTLLLDHIFAEKIDEDQLNESHLTIGDLEKLKVAFAGVLLGGMHQRVRYPYETPGGIQFHLVGPDEPTVTTAEQHY